MKRIIAPIVGISFLFLIAKTDILQSIYSFAVWLIRLNLSSPNVSIGSKAAIKILTFLVTYAVVGELFDVLDWFDSDVMHIAYIIISTIISFLLCHLFSFVEVNSYWILIAMAVIIAIGTVWMIIARIKESKQ